MTHTLQNAEPPIVGAYNGFEVYSMPMFAVLAVQDPQRSRDWYERALGFGTMLAAPVLHLRRRKYQDLLLVARGGETPSTAVALSFDADGEIDALFERARSVAPVGRAAVEPVSETPWNTRELRVTDPDGHRLVFFARSSNPSPEAQRQWRDHLEAGRVR